MQEDTAQDRRAEAGAIATRLRLLISLPFVCGDCQGIAETPMRQAAIVLLAIGGASVVLPLAKNVEKGFFAPRRREWW